MPLLAALLPAFGLIALGYGLRRLGFPGPRFWRGAESLTYYLLLPALLVHGLSGAQFAVVDPLPTAGAIALASLLLTALVLALRPALRVDGPAFSSVYQGALRPNIYVAIAAAVGLGGEAGLLQASIVIAVFVPLANVLSVAVLAAYAHPRAGLTHALWAVLRNPMVLACALGLSLNLLGIALPELLRSLLQGLGRAALPIGLLAVGAGLQLALLARARGVVVLGAALKLLVFPGIALGVGLVLGLGPLATAVVVAFAAVPGSGSAYVLAGQLGGDQPLLAAMISLQMLLAVLSLPLMLWLAGLP
jgi:predicted permease